MPRPRWTIRRLMLAVLVVAMLGAGVRDLVQQRLTLPSVVAGVVFAFVLYAGPYLLFMAFVMLWNRVFGLALVGRVERGRLQSTEAQPSTGHYTALDNEGS